MTLETTGHIMKVMKTKAEKKDELIRKGLKAFYEKGYNATGVKELVESAGVPKGSFYNYFKNKEHFVVEAMQFFTRRELAFCQKYLEDLSTPPLARIVRLYEAKIDYFKRQRTFSLGCFLSNMTLEMADVSPLIAEAATSAFEEENRPVLSCLAEAQETGELASSRDIHQISHLIHSSWLGALVIMKANKNSEALDNFRWSLGEIILK